MHTIIHIQAYTTKIENKMFKHITPVKDLLLRIIQQIVDKALVETCSKLTKNLNLLSKYTPKSSTLSKHLLHISHLCIDR
jgi:hypothetical protein